MGFGSDGIIESFMLLRQQKFREAEMAKYELPRGKWSFQDGVAIVPVKIDGEERVFTDTGGSPQQAYLRACQQVIQGITVQENNPPQGSPVYGCPVEVSVRIGGRDFRGIGADYPVAYIDAINRWAHSQWVDGLAVDQRFGLNP
jgi:hypothetical protein